MWSVESTGPVTNVVLLPTVNVPRLPTPAGGPGWPSLFSPVSVEAARFLQPSAKPPRPNTSSARKSVRITSPRRGSRPKTAGLNPAARHGTLLLRADAPEVLGPADEDVAVGERRRREHLLPQRVLRQKLVVVARLHHVGDAVVGGEVH